MEGIVAVQANSLQRFATKGSFLPQSQRKTARAAARNV
jgi:hypothetical protein